MPDLPLGEFDYYDGIDPGFTGGIARLSADGRTAQVWPMPIVWTGETDRTREPDLPGLATLLYSLVQPGPGQHSCVGLEWNTTRPGDGAERCYRSGDLRGVVRAVCYCYSGREPHRISPALWKGRLGVPGKDDPKWRQKTLAAVRLYLPAHEHLVVGPRGGLLDGLADALLIAYFLQSRTIGAARSIVERFGKDSDQAWAFILGGGRSRQKKN